MKKNRRRRARAICAVLAALVLAGIMCIPDMPAYAAGTINVNVAGMDGLDTDFPGFTFNLYEVGAYNGPDFMLYDKYKDVVNVQIPRYDEAGQEDPKWQEKWLAAAKTLANHIEHPAEGAAPVTPDETFTGIKAGNPIKYQADKNALYLLVGQTAQYNKMNYTPVPIFVRTLNGEETYTISNTDALVKIVAEPVVYNHALAKDWSGEPVGADGKPVESQRPLAVDVGIYYGKQLIDTITLGGESGKWTYSWKSEEAGKTYKYIGEKKTKTFEPGENDNKWYVKEIVNENEIVSDEAKAAIANLHFYEPEYTENTSASAESFMITNKFAARSLELTKEIDGYDIDDQNITFPFLITGTDSSGKVIYTNHVGVVFVRDGKFVSEPTRIEYIPKEVETITVEEEYSANYSQDGDPQITFDSENNIWKIHVKNKHDGHGPKSGVVNKYRHDQEKPEQQGIAKQEGSADEN